MGLMNNLLNSNNFTLIIIRVGLLAPFKKSFKTLFFSFLYLLKKWNNELLFKSIILSMTHLLYIESQE